MKKILLALSVLAACCGYDDSGVDAAIESVEKVSRPIFQACNAHPSYGYVQLRTQCGDCVEMSCDFSYVANFTSWYTPTNCGNPVHTWNDAINYIETGGACSIRAWHAANYSSSTFAIGEYWYVWNLIADGWGVSSLKAWPYTSPP